MTKVKIGTGCIVCEDSDIQGDVTIGNGTIVHPKAKILAEAGPIIIGENNLIEERTVISNKVTNTSGPTPVMIIGNFNVFEVGSHCEALKVGDNNVFEVKSFVGREVVVSDSCLVGAGCSLIDSEVLPKDSAVYGKDCHRKLIQWHQSQANQMDTLAKLLPTYLKIRK